MKIVTTHECPPVPARNFDWRAGIDGQEEDGADCFGETEVEAVIAFTQEHLTEEAVAGLVWLLQHEKKQALLEDSRQNHCVSMAQGIWRAIRTVEGIV